MHKFFFYSTFILSIYMFLSLFAHHKEVKIVYTAFGIVTPVGGRPVHRSSLNLCTGRPSTGVMIQDAVRYNFDPLMLSKLCSKHVEAYKNLL